MLLLLALCGVMEGAAGGQAGRCVVRRRLQGQRGRLHGAANCPALRLTILLRTR